MASSTSLPKPLSQPRHSSSDWFANLVNNAEESVDLSELVPPELVVAENQERIQAEKSIFGREDFDLIHQDLMQNPRAGKDFRSIARMLSTRRTPKMEPKALVGHLVNFYYHFRHADKRSQDKKTEFDSEAFAVIQRITSGGTGDHKHGHNDDHFMMPNRLRPRRADSTAHVPALTTEHRSLKKGQVPHLTWHIAEVLRESRQGMSASEISSVLKNKAVYGQNVTSAGAPPNLAKLTELPLDIPQVAHCVHADMKRAERSRSDAKRKTVASIYVSSFIRLGLKHRNGRDERMFGIVDSMPYCCLCDLAHATQEHPCLPGLEIKLCGVCESRVFESRERAEHEGLLHVEGDPNEGVCAVCTRTSSEKEIFCCAQCERAYCLQCAGKIFDRVVCAEMTSEDEWRCPVCEQKNFETGIEPPAHTPNLHVKGAQLHVSHKKGASASGGGGSAGGGGGGGGRKKRGRQKEKQEEPAESAQEGADGGGGGEDSSGGSDIEQGQFKSGTKPGEMSWPEATLAVLRSSNRPLTTTQIANEIYKKKYITIRAPQPANNVYGVFHRDRLRHKKKGNTYFVRIENPKSPQEHLYAIRSVWESSNEGRGVEATSSPIRMPTLSTANSTLTPFSTDGSGGGADETEPPQQQTKPTSSGETQTSTTSGKLKQMPWREAVKYVLRKAGKPLPISEISKIIQRDQLVATKCLPTKRASIILSAIKSDMDKKKEDTEFVKCLDGSYGLKSYELVVESNQGSDNEESAAQTIKKESGEEEDTSFLDMEITDAIIGLSAGGDLNQIGDSITPLGGDQAEIGVESGVGGGAELIKKEEEEEEGDMSVCATEANGLGGLMSMHHQEGSLSDQDHQTSMDLEPTSPHPQIIEEEIPNPTIENKIKNENENNENVQLGSDGELSENLVAKGYVKVTKERRSVVNSAYSSATHIVPSVPDLFLPPEEAKKRQQKSREEKSEDVSDGDAEGSTTKKSKSSYSRKKPKFELVDATLFEEEPAASSSEQDEDYRDSSTSRKFNQQNLSASLLQQQQMLLSAGSGGTGGAGGVGVGVSDNESETVGVGAEQSGDRRQTRSSGPLVLGPEHALGALSGLSGRQGGRRGGRAPGKRAEKVAPPPPLDPQEKFVQSLLSTTLCKSFLESLAPLTSIATTTTTPVSQPSDQQPSELSTATTATATASVLMPPPAVESTLTTPSASPAPDGQMATTAPDFSPFSLAVSSEKGRAPLFGGSSNSPPPVPILFIMLIQQIAQMQNRKHENELRALRKKQRTAATAATAQQENSNSPTFNSSNFSEFLTTSAGKLLEKLMSGTVQAKKDMASLIMEISKVPEQPVVPTVTAVTTSGDTEQPVSDQMNTEGTQTTNAPSESQATTDTQNSENLKSEEKETKVEEEKNLETLTQPIKQEEQSSGQEEVSMTLSETNPQPEHSQPHDQHQPPPDSQHALPSPVTFESSLSALVQKHLQTLEKGDDFFRILFAYSQQNFDESFLDTSGYQMYDEGFGMSDVQGSFVLGDESLDAEFLQEMSMLSDVQHPGDQTGCHSVSAEPAPQQGLMLPLPLSSPSTSDQQPHGLAESQISGQGSTEATSQPEGEQNQDGMAKAMLSESSELPQPHSQTANTVQNEVKMVEEETGYTVDHSFTPKLLKICTKENAGAEIFFSPGHDLKSQVCVALGRDLGDLVLLYQQVGENFLGIYSEQDVGELSDGSTVFAHFREGKQMVM